MGWPSVLLVNHYHSPMSKATDTLDALLQKRRDDLSIRSLAINTDLIDFASNDYLGFARSVELKQRVGQEYAQYTNIPEGATGSRLIAGNHIYYETLEMRIAAYHGAEAGLIYNSGYDANLGLFSSVPQPGDWVLFDELVHASIRDGIKMGRAQSQPFQHNNMADLERLLQTTNANNIYIATESLFSMDGDLAPLTEMVALCKQYGANLIVDEAHATGIYGKRGEGRIAELGLQKDCFARVHTFGKALGGHGAIVLGSVVLREFLVNFSRSFIYTTALPMHNLVWIKCAYDMLPDKVAEVHTIHALRQLLENELAPNNVIQLMTGPGPIQAIIVPGNDRAKRVATKLAEGGIYAKAILYPTVPRGAERIRVCLHSFNTASEVFDLCNIINNAI